MRIIDKNTDFYDYIQYMWGYDDSSSFDRTDSFLLTKEEFGLEREGGILLVPSFSRGMRYLCGTQFTVKNIYKDNCGICYRSFEGGENERPFGHWYISADMLEPFAEDDFEVANDEDMKLLFG